MHNNNTLNVKKKNIFYQVLLVQNYLRNILKIYFK